MRHLNENWKVVLAALGFVLFALMLMWFFAPAHAAPLELAISVQGRVTVNGQLCLQVGSINPSASSIEIQQGSGGSSIAYPRPWAYAPGDCFPVNAAQSMTQVRECIAPPSLGCGGWVAEPDFVPPPTVPETLPPRVASPPGYPVSVRTVRNSDPPNPVPSVELLTDVGVVDESSAEWCWTTDLTFTATSAFCTRIKSSSTDGYKIFYQGLWALGSVAPSDRRIWFKFCRSTLTPPPDGLNDCASVPWTMESALSCCGVSLNGGCRDDIWPTSPLIECPLMPPGAP